MEVISTGSGLAKLLAIPLNRAKTVLIKRKEAFSLFCYTTVMPGPGTIESLFIRRDREQRMEQRSMANITTARFSRFKSGTFFSRDPRYFFTKRITDLAPGPVATR